MNLNLHAHLQKEINVNAEAPALKRKEKPVNVPPGSASKTHTKREFCQILARKFGTIRLAKCLFRFGEKK
jgi:hypothetical protein